MLNSVKHKKIQGPTGNLQKEPSAAGRMGGAGVKRKSQLLGRAAGVRRPQAWGSWAWDAEWRQGGEKREAEVRTSVRPPASDVAGGLRRLSVVALGSGVVPLHGFPTSRKGLDARNH